MCLQVLVSDYQLEFQLTTIASFSLLFQHITGTFLEIFLLEPASRYNRRGLLCGRFGLDLCDFVPAKQV